MNPATSQEERGQGYRLVHSTDSPNDVNRRRERAFNSRLGIDEGVYAGRVELRIPAGLDFESWYRLGKHIRRISDSSSWWLADWLVYGEKQFADRYKVVIEGTTLSYQTLRNYSWVARKIPPSRRRGALSLQHHAEAASLSEEEQDLWLARAEREGWSVSRLRRELSNRNQLRGRGDRTPTQVRLNLNSEHMDRWMHAAEAAHIPLMDWIVQVLDDAAAS